MAEEKAKRENLSDNEIESLEQWLKSWGDGPNWADPSGVSVPIVKTQLKALLEDRNTWKKRAIAHGCDAEGGDPDCG